MRKIITILLALAILPAMQVFAQSKDKAKFEPSQNHFYPDVIMKDVKAVQERLHPQKKHLYFMMDQSGMDLPNKVSLYKTFWHTPTTSQGNTGTCWCFSTTSFFESEEHRLFGKDVKLSEMYTVYWEYVEKAKGYVESRGTTVFDEGSEANAVRRDYKKYGIVPRSVYDGFKDGRKFYSHAEMVKEMKTYLHSVKAADAWNEDAVVATIKAILNRYMGEPPTHFTYQGKEYTPKSFLKDYLKLNMDDYVDVLSYEQQPFWHQVEYQVPDNWWHSKAYYNVPLKVFMDVWNTAIEHGYTMAIGGDVSEAGFSRKTNVALIPDFDIPAAYINDNARQFRFSNHTTTDDHGMHCVGYYKDKKGQMWYLIKDSSSGSRNVDPKSPEFGYYFFSTPYVELKMMDFMVHKDMFKKYMKKFPH
ncbi:peptidase C1 [Candidatus Sulfidibacterium hydrothermale]|uniref:C1 family peptidase n=1 Tax=Candidatus Sulfidibacterium hydrothermale TaxID=2875962 RepID=UPI001F0AA4FE|nr:C1 family peptidase [Candidatus Sulfidibacterium hydrothermale]UBM61245.1 peptidase C1 [Candidatus Sulfidibacterium hydrothermale]